jgi:hypothetical protein
MISDNLILPIVFLNSQVPGASFRFFFWRTSGSFSKFSPLSPITEASLQPSGIPGGIPPEDWQSAVVGWGDAGFGSRSSLFFPFEFPFFLFFPSSVSLTVSYALSYLSYQVILSPFSCFCQVGVNYEYNQQEILALKGCKCDILCITTYW